ncbi:MAG: hypothetical protein AB7O38_20120 [Pirellulaceae bacterium]
MRNRVRALRLRDLQQLYLFSMLLIRARFGGDHLTAQTPRPTAFYASRSNHPANRDIN